jgi:hypothetical protein
MYFPRTVFPFLQFREGDSEAALPSRRRSTGLLPSGVYRGDGVWRGARLLGRRASYSCRFRSTSFYFLVTTSRVLPRVRMLWHVSGGGGGSGAVSGGCRRSLLFLRLGEWPFGARRVRYVCPFALVVQRDLLPCALVVSLEAGAAASGLRLFLTAVLDSGFPCQRRSGSGRWLFNVLSVSCCAHGAVSCGVSKVWSWPPFLAGGFGTGVFVRCFFDFVPSCGRQ